MLLLCYGAWHAAQFAFARPVQRCQTNDVLELATTLYEVFVRNAEFLLVVLGGLGAALRRLSRTTLALLFGEAQAPFWR